MSRNWLNKIIDRVCIYWLEIMMVALLINPAPKFRVI
jgi:hypothetical protein